MSRRFEIDADDLDDDEQEIVGGLDPNGFGDGAEVYDPRELARMYGRGSKHR